MQQDIAISVVTGEAAVSLGPTVWPCYDEVFGDVSSYEAWRSDLFERHARRDGYRLALARRSDHVVGFSWGYIGQRGQWWSDAAAEALPAGVAAQWIGGHFEFVELAVRPSDRGKGVGQALHDRLLDGVRRRCLLSTSDDDSDPAVRLYLRNGWGRLGSLQPNTQIMGLDRT
ncbi:GNAT family N-acetyltransferase [Branchiibius sp. NY16-3462-2]|uniref:GNAT family N-acetyltransferase n=1 Tax=Branchiibius sp. NY16-3462-2 TaxID=1807500 RepID=UPI000792AE2C|nr:GNAT family N-acetyltransferase [Branchiibius sp. NY16-3462-2]KYH45498.1 hypothetical protein AZH51_00890 [Branchiibius sp. NY16-3462-2]